MKDATTGKTSKASASTDWAALKTLTAEQIHAGIEEDPDALPTDTAFWENARVVLPKSKHVVTMRLDEDVLNWFKSQGTGYQSRINAILRAYMTAQEKNARPPIS